MTVSMKKYFCQVPRYTSYPTAPHFSADVGENTYRKWLSSCSAEESLSLYVHVPFCRDLCWFCGCHTKIVNHYRPVASYVQLLTREMTFVGDALPAQLPTSHLHFGGGSPSILNGDDFSLIMQTLRDSFQFQEGMEIAIEIEPRTTFPEMIDIYAAEGVNRVSLGIQDFTPEVQEAINRYQTFSDTEQLLEQFRSRGIEKFNVDLMYGLPHQTVASISASTDLAMDLAPDRISLFGYAHVPWFKPHQNLINAEFLPDAQARLELYEAASEKMLQRGYVSIGLDHFAREDDEIVMALRGRKLHRNFQGYTTDTSTTLLGFGASAVGLFPQGYIQNASDYKAYREVIESGQLASSRGIEVGKDDQLRREVIEQLMCYLSVDLKTICSVYGEDIGYFSQEIRDLETMTKDGLVTVEGGLVSIEPSKRAFLRVVCAVFDRYLHVTDCQHSQSI